MKLSEDVEKVSIPGKKNLYRLYGHDGIVSPLNHTKLMPLENIVQRLILLRLYFSLPTGKALVDLMTQSKEKVPVVGSRILCRHPVLENKRAWVSPSKIENLYKVYWKDGKVLYICSACLVNSNGGYMC